MTYVKQQWSEGVTNPPYGPVSAARLAHIEDGLEAVANGGYLPASLGGVGDGVTDDTAAIQAVLTGTTGWIKGAPGRNYLISSPLVIGANTILDMRGSTITLKAGSSCNMLQNTALASARSVIDGAITSGLNVLTSATAVFSAADVGKAVTVVGADSTGGRRLVTTISGFTNSTTVTLTANAGTTVTNAWVTIGTRDQNIVLLGGLWDRAANGGASFGYNGNTIRMRRVDGFRCYGVQLASTNGKYGINPGDVWDFKVEDTRAVDYFADVVHVNGPARHGVIRDTYADHAGDDVVSLTCADFHTFASMDDTAGDISDVLVDGVRAAYGGRRAAIGLAGAGRTLARITYRNCGGEFANAMLQIGGDYQDTATQGGTYTSILVDGVKADPGSGPSQGAVFLSDGTYDDITIRDVYPDAGMQSGVVIGGTQTNQNPTIETLIVDGAYWTGGISPNALIQVTRGTIKHLIGNELRVVTANQGVHLVRVTASTPASTINRLSLSNFRLETGGAGTTSSIVGSTDSAATIGFVQLSNGYTKNVTYPLARYASSVTVEASNIVCEAASAIARVEAAGTVTIYALNINSNAYNVSTGGGTILWASEQEQVVADTYSASITPNAQAGRVHQIVVTNATAFTINAPTSTPPATGTQDLSIEISNTSGGAMGVITWNAAFKFAGYTWTNPATANKRMASFRWNGTAWICQGVSLADYT